jgi:hypothetical protein
MDGGDYRVTAGFHEIPDERPAVRDVNGGHIARVCGVVGFEPAGEEVKIARSESSRLEGESKI